MRRISRSHIAFLLMIGLGAPAAAQTPPCEPEPTQDSVFAFVGANVLPMSDDTVLIDHTVVVRNGRIAAVGPRRRITVPRSVVRIEARGRWLMPGLADAHVHTVGPPAITRRLFLIGLTQGVTTAMVLSGDTLALQLRDRFATGADLGPTLYVAGPLVEDSTMTYSEGIRLAEEYHGAGYDLIKVYNRLSRSGYRGVMLRAEQLGVPVVGHVVRSMDVEGVLGAGQRGIVHMEEYLHTYFGLKMSDTTLVAEEILDPAAIPYLASITADAGTYVTPTLVAWEGMLALAEDLESALEKPGMAYLGKVLRDALRRHGKSAYADKFAHPRQVHNLREALAFQRRMTRAFHEAGVPLVAGTDAPIAVTMPGFALRRELQHLVDAGLSPHQALTAATRNAAEYIGEGEEFGTVQIGTRADLLLLEANPREDVTAVERIAGVMTRGRWLDRQRIEAVLTCLREAGQDE